MSDILGDLLKVWKATRPTILYYSLSDYDIPEVDEEGKPFILYLSEPDVFLFHPNTLSVLKDKMPDARFLLFNWNEYFKRPIKCKFDFIDVDGIGK